MHVCECAKKVEERVVAFGLEYKLVFYLSLFSSPPYWRIQLKVCRSIAQLPFPSQRLIYLRGMWTEHPFELGYLIGMKALCTTPHCIGEWGRERKKKMLRNKEKGRKRVCQLQTFFVFLSFFFVFFFLSSSPLLPLCGG
jgi:hypothetical protein